MEQNGDARWWDDEEFQDRLCALLVRDQKSLAVCGSILSPDDFRPIRGMRHGVPRQIVVERALEHYKRHHEPLGELARADVLEYGQSFLGASKVADLRGYLDFLSKINPKSPDAIAEKALKFKTQHLRAAAIDELVSEQSAGTLTEERWREIVRKATPPSNGVAAVDYKATLADRIERRRLEQVRSRVPWTFIDPLDSMIRTVGPKQLGLVIAPYKRGKSMFLEWLDVAFAYQRMNVFHFTFEDPREIVEDRLDAILTQVPMKELATHPRTTTERFQRKQIMMPGNIRIQDGLSEAWTIPMIDAALEREREKGFIPNAIMVDYDEKIAAQRQHRDKRNEIDEVYQDFQRLIARWNCVGWLAAQTKRDTSHMKILTGDQVAEDIGKARKAFCGLTLGRGEWTEESIYLHVAAHKNDRMLVGCEIVPDKARGLIYDCEATARAQKEHQEEEME